MRMIFGLFLLLTSAPIYGAEFQIDAKEREALIVEYTEQYGRDLNIPWFRKRFEEIREGNNIDLVLAARKGDAVLCEYLLAQGIKIDVINGAALKEAIRGNHVDCVKLLIERGANVKPYQIDQDGGTECNAFLYEAAQAGSIDILKLLRDAGASIHDGRALLTAVSSGKVEAVRWFIEQGASVHMGVTGIGFFRPIHEAAAVGDNQMIELLVAFDADVNCRGPVTHKNMTPLHFAANNGYVSSMQLLKEHGADESLKRLSC